tara:strand:- start:4894 stop:6756 length:1863 start_codon:yes stop_codon:yes gene_type:complete
MAPRSRYLGIQRQIGTSGYRGPSGVGIQQAQRTSQMLVSALDSMSSYFFKKASVQAEKEGAEYGAENPITIKQLTESAYNGTSVTDRFDDDTIFGRSAKKIALESVGSDLALSAKRNFSDLISKATLNGTDLSEVSNDLKAITNEYVKIANNASPILARKLYAELGVNSSAHYNAYSKVYAKRSLDELRTGTALNLNFDLKSMGIELDAVLNFEGDEDGLTAKIYGAGQYQNGKLLSEKARNKAELKKAPGFEISKKYDYIYKASKAKYTKTMMESALKDWDDKWLEVRTSTIVSTALETETSSDLAMKIHLKQKTGNIKIDAILNGMSDKERLDVAKAIRAEKSAQINFENTIQDKKDGDADNKIAELEVDLNNQLAFGAKDDLNEKLSQLEALAPDKYKDLKIKFDQSDGLRTVSDSRVKADLIKKVSTDNLSFGELLEKYDDLSSKDYNDLMAKVEVNEKQETKTAMSIIAGEMGFSPEVEILGETDPNFEKSQIYRRIKGRVEEALLDAQKDGKNFDAVAIARAVFANENEGIQIKVYEGKLLSAKAIIDRFAEAYPNKGIQKNYTRSEFEKVKNMLIVLQPDDNKKSRVKDYRNISIINADIQGLKNVLSSSRLQ